MDLLSIMLNKVIRKPKPCLHGYMGMGVSGGTGYGTERRKRVKIWGPQQEIT